MYLENRRKTTLHLVRSKTLREDVYTSGDKTPFRSIAKRIQGIIVSYRTSCQPYLQYGEVVCLRFSIDDYIDAAAARTTESAQTIRGRIQKTLDQVRDGLVPADKTQTAKKEEIEGNLELVRETFQYFTGCGQVAKERNRGADWTHQEHVYASVCH
jgi:ElaB/YqjD/DUF883 family membrane-anchored ribosome-binding protein